MPRLTREQQLAVHLRGADLIVSAAAGSGKTAVLVERIINIITDNEKPVDIDRLLVVTFTEQAAFEMRRRIEARLNELLSEKPDDAVLNRQLALLNRSFIMTIHAFCMNVVKNYFYIIDLDPNFKVADPAELSILKQELLDELLETEYENGDPDFMALSEFFSKKLSDAPVRELIADVHAFISAFPWPLEKLREYAGFFDIEKIRSIDETVWAPAAADAIRTELNGMVFELGLSMQICDEEDGPAKYIDCLTDESEMLEGLARAESFTGMYREFTAAGFGRLPSYRKDEYADERKKNAVKKSRDGVKLSFNAIKKKYFRKPPELMLEDLKSVRTPITKLAELVERFADAYRIAKRDRNVLDFNDLEHYSLAILTGEVNGRREPSATARELRDCYEEILIDEYQDSNPVQELILSSVAEDCGNRFMVGDVKQSIYKFRQARPDIFISKYKNAAYFGGERAGGGLKIDLNQNFRSRENLLRGINALFYQMMTETVGDTAYDANSALYYGADYPECETAVDDSVELIIVDMNKNDGAGGETDGNDNKNGSEDDTPDAKNYGENRSGDDDDIPDADGVEIEAGVIAARIEQLVSGETAYPVYDKTTGRYRSARYGDVAILSQSVKTIGGAFSSLFGRRGIPLSVISAGSFFDSVEIATVVSILQIIDNPKQDLHLIAFLHSPVYALTEDDLLNVRSRSPAGCFYDAMLYCLSNPEGAGYEKTLNKVKTDLAAWRESAKSGSVSELLWRVYRETNCFNYAGAMPDGRRRQARLRALAGRAVRYEETSYRGLFHFIKYIEKLRGSRAEIAEREPEQNDGSVRMMTIHASKGLEFPIVFLCRAGKRFNTDDQRGELALHSEFGFGPHGFDPARRVRCVTLARLAINNAAAAENLSEQMRVLYVAMTRAKEKLIITSTANDAAKVLDKWSRYTGGERLELPAHYMLKAKTFLDWIAPAAMRAGDETAVRMTVTPYAEAASVLKERAAGVAREMLFTVRPASPERSRVREEVFKKLSWRYGFERETKLPQKISITEIKRLYNLERARDSELPEYFSYAPEYDRPDFMRRERGASAADVGRATHALMQQLDLFAETDVDHLKNLASDLASRGLAAEEALPLIPYGRVVNFARSELADRIRNSPFVRREAPFVMRLASCEVYPDDPGSAGESILLHGIIDIYFKERDGYVLIDYKSDSVRAGTDRIKEKYATQLGVYARAVEESTGGRVIEKILYLFDADRYVSL